MASFTFKLATAAVAVAVAGAACSSPDTNDEARAPRHTTTINDTNEQLTEDRFAADAFAVPFDFVLPSWLSTGEAVSGPNLVTWEPLPLGSPTVRFMVPTAVYPPDGTGPMTPPRDYLPYLLGQADQGAVFTDRTETEVDGHPATLVTATAPAPMDGSLGCPVDTMPPEECYGLQPGLDLRVAVVDVDGKPLVVWLRHDRQLGADPGPEFAAFEDVLATVHFR